MVERLFAPYYPALSGSVGAQKFLLRVIARFHPMRQLPRKHRHPSQSRQSHESSNELSRGVSYRQNTDEQSHPQPTIQWGELTAIRRLCRNTRRRSLNRFVEQHWSVLPCFLMGCRQLSVTERRRLECASRNVAARARIIVDGTGKERGKSVNDPLPVQRGCILACLPSHFH